MCSILAVFVTKSWPIDIEDKVRGQKAWHTTRPLMLVTISAAYEKNSPGAAMLQSGHHKVCHIWAALLQSHGWIPLKMKIWLNPHYTRCHILVLLWPNDLEGIAIASWTAYHRADNEYITMQHKDNPFQLQRLRATISIMQTQDRYQVRNNIWCWLSL